MKNMKHKHSFEEILYYKKTYCSGTFYLEVYKVLVCNCNKMKKSRKIYFGTFSSSQYREESLKKFISSGAISEEDFAIKYR